MGIRHHTKDKGDLAVAEAFVDLTRQGYLVLWPSTEHAPFDLVAYRDGRFERVQVKYCTPVNGKMEIRFRSSWSDRNGSHHQPMVKDEVDVLCAFDPVSGGCYYLRPRDHRKSVSLRLEPARNGQHQGVIDAAALRSRMPD